MSGWTFGFLSPQALAWALAGSALLTTLFYFLRLKRRPEIVPFIQLWQSLILDKKAAALRSQLKRLISLFISLLVVAALIFAFADPRSPSERRGRHMVVLIDSGLSMSRTIPGSSRSCLDLAREQVTRWFQSLGPGDEMLLVEMGARPRPLDAFTSDADQLKRALSTLRPLDVRPDLEAALGLAGDVLSTRTSPEIIVIGDDGLQQNAPRKKTEDLPPLRFLNLSSQCLPSVQPPAENVRIDVFSARRYPLAGDRFEVLLSASSDAEEAVSVEIAIYGVTKEGDRGALLDLVQEELTPGLRKTLTFSNLSQAEGGILAEIKRRDLRPELDTSDNWALAVLSQRLPVRVLVVGELDTFLEAALLIEESLVIKQISPESYPPPEQFDVTVFNGTAVPRDPRTGAAVYLGLDAVGESPAKVEAFPVAMGAELSMFGFDTWDKESRVFQLIDPYDIQVLQGFELKASKGDQVLGNSQGRAILVAGERQEGSFLALGFRPTKSDFVLRPAWPLFVVNLIDTLYPRGRGEVLSSGHASRELRIPVADSSATLAEVHGPLLAGRSAVTRKVPVVDGYAVLYSQQAGFYDVRTPSGVTRVALSTERIPHAQDPVPKESDRLGQYSVTEPVGMEPRSNFDPWFWLLLGVFAVSFVEWWSFHRSWTV